MMLCPVRGSVGPFQLVRYRNVLYAWPVQTLFRGRYDTTPRDSQCGGGTTFPPVVASQRMNPVFCAFSDCAVVAQCLL